MSGLPTSGLPTGGQSWGGQSWVNQSSGLPTPTIMFFMNCLCLIWVLGECWEHGQYIQSQYFEEQSNSCNFMRHLITHSGEKSTNATNLTMHPLGQAIWGTNANSVILYPTRQEIWGDIWKHAVEKSQTKVTSAIICPLVHTTWGLIWKHIVEKLNKWNQCEYAYKQMQPIWGHICIHTVEKSYTNVTGVTWPPLG